jgi:hypothetical protein
MSVVDFPEQPAPPPLLVGPFQEWRVIVNGRRVPRLTGVKQGDGSVMLVLDHRLGFEFPSEEVAYQAASLAGNAMAIEAGYPHFGAETKDQPFAPISMEITSGLLGMPA